MYNYWDMTSLRRCTSDADQWVQLHKNLAKIFSILLIMFSLSAAKACWNPVWDKEVEVKWKYDACKHCYFNDSNLQVLPSILIEWGSVFCCGCCTICCSTVSISTETHNESFLFVDHNVCQADLIHRINKNAEDGIGCMGLWKYKLDVPQPKMVPIEIDQPKPLQNLTSFVLLQLSGNSISAIKMFIARAFQLGFLQQKLGQMLSTPTMSPWKCVFVCKLHKKVSTSESRNI